jgi:putative endonuclease
MTHNAIVTSDRGKMKSGPASRGETGSEAEALAARHLEAAGMKILQRNFRGRTGEIDLVMLEGHLVVFVEVRYRRDHRFGSPLETVDLRKRRKLINTAALFMQKYDPSGRLNYRFDVVGISGELCANPVVQWVPAAF